MDFFEANFVFKELVASGRQIIGFDLCEVSPGEHPEQSNEWDANVGMRLLYKLTGWALRSQRR
jgi:agmatinase